MIGDVLRASAIELCVTKAGEEQKSDRPVLGARGESGAETRKLLAGEVALPVPFTIAGNTSSRVSGAKLEPFRNREHMREESERSVCPDRSVFPARMKTRDIRSPDLVETKISEPAEDRPPWSSSSWLWFPSEAEKRSVFFE